MAGLAPADPGLTVISEAARFGRGGGMRRLRVDAVVVGCRVAGAATSIALARAGRRVIALERAKFPADTLSTHLLFAGGVAELQRLGSLDRVLATGVPKMPALRLVRAGHDIRAAFTPVEGIDYGLCCRRPALDAALADTARAQGVEVLERTSVDRLIWRDGRAAGVVAHGPDGEELEISCRLVVGADGRRSTVANLAGVAEPYRTDPNRRGMVFYYSVEPRGPGERPDEIVQWKSNDTLGMYFPVDDGHGLTILMPPREQVARFRGDADRMWQRALAGLPGLAERIAPTSPRQKQRTSIDHPSFFRVSSGPGWALVGDAGHFKDPVVAQGIRDALHYGRRLGELAGEALDDPRWLDRRLRAYETERDLDCIQMYYLGLRETIPEPVGPVEAEMAAEAARKRPLADQLADMFARTCSVSDVFTLARKARWGTRALRRRGADREAIQRYIARDLAFEARLSRDLVAIRRGGRPAGGRFSRWGRDGWTPMLPDAPATQPAGVSQHRPIDLTGSAAPADAMRCEEAMQTQEVAL